MLVVNLFLATVGHVGLVGHESDLPALKFLVVMIALQYLGSEQTL